MKEKDSLYKTIVKSGIIIITYIFILVNIDTLYDVIDRIKTIMVPFIIGFALAYLINQLVKFVDKALSKIFKRPCKYWIALLVSYIIVVIFVLLSIFVVGPQLINSIDSLLKSIPDRVQKAEAWIESDAEEFMYNLTGGKLLVTDITSWVENMFQGIVDTIPQYISKAATITANIAKGTLNALLSLLISIYMLMHKNLYKAQLKKVAHAYLGEQKAKDMLSFWANVDRTFGKFLQARIVDSAIIGILCYIGCLILGFNNSVLIAVLVGVTNVIPYFGPFIGAIPSALIVLMQSPQDMIVFIIFIIILQQFDGNILGPKLLGDSLGLTSLWIIFAVMIATYALGVVGMVIGVPIFAIIYMLLRKNVNDKLEKMGISSDTKDYMN